MRASLIACILLLCASVQAAVIDQPLADSSKELEARALFHEFKCVVCEGQSLADSDATLALQMRARIRDMLAEGKTPDEITQYFRESYGERILMRPPVEDKTLLLWAMPLVMLLGGGILIRNATRRKDVP